jgi:hypothetical protein
MRNLLLALGLLLLAACAPTMTGTMERGSGDLLTVTVATTGEMFSVNLIVHEATTDDPRCVALGVDIGCLLGTVTSANPVVVVVAGTPGNVSCTVFGYSNPILTLTSYRAVACQVKR